MRTKAVARIERWLGATASTLGRAIARGAAAVPAVVARASGIEEPSPAVAVAGVVGGVTALAPCSLGPIAGRCVQAAGALAVLAVARWTVHARFATDVAAAAGVLEAALAAAVRARLDARCGPPSVLGTLSTLVEGAHAPLHAWSSMADAARLVHAVELHADRVAAERRRVGEGAAVVVLFPRRLAA